MTKTYGAVVALRDASLTVRPGEVHALMGANGAGKSTLVKILTAAVQPDSGTITIRGKPWVARSPAQARRGGIISVYQEPSLIPDLDIRANLRLTDTPIEPFRHWLGELGLTDLDLSDLARHVPLASLRIIDLARALAIEPAVLMLDEMTAALPANLTERVLEVNRTATPWRPVGDLRLAHRMVDSSAVCDRATVLREGATVRVVERDAGGADRRADARQDRERRLAAEERVAGGAEKIASTPRLTARNLAARTKLQDVSFDLHQGEVLGVVALEGQGQDEFFDILAGSDRPTAGGLLVDGAAVTFRHPADAVRGPVSSTWPRTAPRRC